MSASTTPNVEPSLSCDSLRRRIRALLPELRDRYHVLQVTAFGSRTRQDATADSDLDLLVTFDTHASLFDLVELELELEKRLGMPVDIVTPGSIKPRLRERIFQSAVTV